MELTAEIFILGGIISAFVSVLALDLYLKVRYKSVQKVMDSVEKFVDKKGSDKQLSEAIDSFVHIGGLASNVNEIMADPDLFSGLLSELANRVMKAFQMSMLGTKSGDSRKLEKANRLVNNAIVEGLGNSNPMIKILLKATGLDKEIEDDPEMFGYILEAISQNKGIMGMVQNLGGIEGLMNASPQDQETIRQEITKGIDF